MTRLKPFQLEGARGIYRFRGRALLADEMGLGKTLQSLYWLMKIPRHRPAVVVCPASMKYTWQAEALLHFGMHLEVLDGRFRGWHLAPPRKSILVLNYDILASWGPFLRKLRPKCLILDEVHYIKNLKAQRTQTVLRLTPGIPSVIGLSGTPLTNRPIELWSVLQAIRPDIYPSRRAFAWRYCKPRFTPWGWMYDGARRLGELHRILRSNCMIRRLKSEVMDQLPRKERHVVTFRLKSYGEYEEAENSFLKWLAKISPSRARRAKRSQALTRVGYLIRLVCKLKLPWTVKWLEEFFEAHEEEKIVAFTMHTFVIDELKQRFPDALVIDGRTPTSKRSEIVRQFRSPRKRLLLGNWIAAGIGITLTPAWNIAALDMPWTPGDLLQGEDRCHRIGQKHNVLIHYLTVQDTIEERQMNLLRKKSRILEAVLDGKASSQQIDIFEALLESMKGKL